MTGARIGRCGHIAQQRRSRLETNIQNIAGSKHSGQRGSDVVEQGPAACGDPTTACFLSHRLMGTDGTS